MPTTTQLTAALCVAATFGLATVSSAKAQTNCMDLPNPIYLQVGDTQEPLMKAMGRSLASSSAKPMTLVYVTSGSCTNIQAIYQDIKITTNAKYVPSATMDPTWTTAGASPTCVMETGGHAVDVANSALFVSACDPNDPPAGIALFPGPVQAYGFMVPEASTQKVITAEEAYFAFGDGAAGMVAPWNQESFMFIRPSTKSTLLSLAAAIHVPAAKWHGVVLDKSSEVVSAVKNSTTPEATIGILGVEIYDQNRSTLNLLAYRAYAQKHAYFPDKTSESFDKQNVRDGHYLPWAPTVWLTHVDGTGKATNDNAEYLIDLIRGEVTTPAPDFEPLDNVISVGLVPGCAMHVQRSYEGGELSSYQAPQPCDCYYQSKTGGAPASCLSCDDQSPCVSGACRNNS
jgi:hypothetical protein